MLLSLTGEVNFVRDFDFCTIVHCRTAADLFKTDFPTCANLQEQWQNTVAREKHAVNTSPAIGVLSVIIRVALYGNTLRVSFQGLTGL